jgi:hypothetical protein
MLSSPVNAIAPATHASATAITIATVATLSILFHTLATNHRSIDKTYVKMLGIVEQFQNERKTGRTVSARGE